MYTRARLSMVHVGQLWYRQNNWDENEDRCVCSYVKSNDCKYSVTLTSISSQPRVGTAVRLLKQYLYRQVNGNFCVTIPYHTLHIDPIDIRVTLVLLWYWEVWIPPDPISSLFTLMAALINYLMSLWVSRSP